VPSVPPWWILFEMASTMIKTELRGRKSAL